MFFIFDIWIKKKKSKKNLYMPESESASKVLHRGNPGAGSQQRHHLLALITDNFYICFYIFDRSRERHVPW